MKGRLEFFATLLRQHVWGLLIATASLLYSALTFWRDEIATPEQQEQFRAIHYLPNWPISWWLAITFSVFALWIFEAAYKLQRPGLQLLFKEAPRTIESGIGPLRYKISVALRNSTSQVMHNCRLQVQIISHDSISRPDYVRLPICAPFRLSPDEVHYIDVAGYDFDVKDAALEIPHFMRVGDQWEDTGSKLILLPGRHDVMVEALSDNSRIARLKLDFDNKNDRWWVNGESTGA
jgi:hypothetical protein